MFYTRYRFARDFCREKEVLEIACGGGQGLGYLAKPAARVTGIDIDTKVLEYPAKLYAGRTNISVAPGDACALSFPDNSFDIIVLFDSVYWLKDQDLFMRECRRVLRKGGRLIISTVNPQWSEFNPSPYATTYLDARGLLKLYADSGFVCEICGAFPCSEAGLKEKVITAIRKVAIKTRAIPVSIKGKEILKRIFYGRIRQIPAEVYDGMGDYSTPVTITASLDNPPYKILFAVGTVSK